MTMEMDKYEAETQLKEQAFDEEREKLERVVEAIRQGVIRVESQKPATADHQQTANEIQRVLDNQSESFWRAIEQPYFGRLDYVKVEERSRIAELDDSEDNQENQQTIYLGGTFIRDQKIYSWTSPVGKLWYTQSYDDGYTAPKGYIAARVDLKRHLRIVDGQLEDLTDIFRRQLPAPSSTDGRQELLSEKLSGTGADDGHLTIIIETIEPDQYESIANVSDKVLIVQGAAGSGKSEIGLHRIAFLLSPFSDIGDGERPTPETTLLIGPSQAFLDNADNVLPGLGVAEGVLRARFSEWLSENLSSRQVRFQPRILSDLQKFGEMRDYDETAETFKGSLHMADALDRHVSERTRRIRARMNGVGPLLGPDGKIRVTARQVKDTLAEVLPGRGGLDFPNRRREAFIDRIYRLVERGSQSFTTAERRAATGSDVQRRRWRNEVERIRRDIRRAVVAWCGTTWPQIDFRSEYAALLSDPNRMAALAPKDELSAETARALAASASKNAANIFGDADSGALAYLDHLLNDTIRSRYKHVVVDEAQDISPIEFKLLSLSSENNWFTILGDTAQRLTPYRGIQSWRNVERVFGRADIEVQRARRSYRSTRQITTFTNRILRTFDRRDDQPIPFDREGERVQYSRHPNRGTMFQAVVEEIDQIRVNDYELDREPYTIAVLARDTSNLNALEKFCVEREMHEKIARIGQDGEYTVLARIPDVKGLEYDAVIVMGVNDSFSDTLFNKKLLYMATTRAKHYLSTHWSGTRSPILDEISERGVVGWRRR